MKEKKGYKKLIIWDKAHKLAAEIYMITQNFPREELYGLTSQIRRAASSVPLNIVEGHASNSRKEFLNFLNIANRSLVETEYLLELSLSLSYLNNQDFERIESIREEVGRMLNGFMNTLRKKVQVST